MYIRKFVSLLFVFFLFLGGQVLISTEVAFSPPRLLWLWHSTSVQGLEFLPLSWHILALPLLCSARP